MKNKENDIADSNEDEISCTGNLLAYPNLQEEWNLWRKYYRLRRIDEILRSKADVILKISEDISKSVNLIKLLKNYSGLDANKGRNETKRENLCCLQDIFGFEFSEKLNDMVFIGFGKGNAKLVDEAKKITRNEITDFKNSIYKLSIDLDLFPSDAAKLFDPNSRIEKLPQLVESIYLRPSDINILNDYQSLIDKMRIDGNIARDKIILTHRRLAIKGAHKFELQNGNLTYNDLVQEANIALMEAAENFNPVFGYRFMNFAPNWVHWHLERVIANHGRGIRLPVHRIESINILQGINQSLSQKLGREPTLKELGREMEIPSDKVKELLRLAELPVSLDFPIGDERHTSLGDDIEDFSEPDPDLSDTIEDLNALSPVEAASKQLLKEQIDEVLSSLTHREQRVLVLRFGLEDGRSRTLEEVGQEFNLNRERIRQIEAKALGKLRHPSRSRKLADYLG